MLDGVQIVYGF